MKTITDLDDQWIQNISNVTGGIEQTKSREVTPGCFKLLLYSSNY